MSQTKAQLIEGLNINTSAPADALVIDSSGNVGVGTTSPSAQLHVNSGTANTCATFQSSDAGAAINLTDSDARSTIEQNGSTLSIIADTDAADASSNIRLKVDNTTNLIVDSSGNVGIGLTSPDERLHVYHPTGNVNAVIESGDANAYISFKDSSTSSTSHVYLGAAGNDMQFATGTVERMRIDSSGRLLVGLSSDISGGTSSTNIQLATTGGGFLGLARNDSTVTEGNSLGGLRIYSNDPSGYSKVADLRCEADGTFASSDYPSRWVFTTTADGASSPTERMRIDSSGNVGIGTTSPNRKLQVAGSTAITNSGDTGAFLFDPAGSVNTLLSRAGQSSTTALPLAVKMGNTERLRIDSDGRLLIGTTSARSDIVRPQLNLEGAGDTGLTIVRNEASASGPQLEFGKSRGTSTGSSTVVQNNDEIGMIRFRAADGTDMLEEAARITVAIDGTPGSNDVPGRITFGTTADGASSPTERMRIDSSGNVGIGTTSPGRALHVVTSGAGEIRVADGSRAAALGSTGSLCFVGSVTSGQGFAIHSGNSEQIRITSDGNVGIGLTNPGAFNAKAEKLVLANGGDDVGITLDCDTDKEGSIYFADGSSGDNLRRGQIVYNHDGDSLRFVTNASERVRIDSNGKLLLGITSSLNVANLAGDLQVYDDTSVISAAGFANSGTTCGYLTLGKSRSTTVGTPGTVVQSGDVLGEIRFAGDDGTDLVSQGARISAQVDGTPGSNDMPGRLVFSTTADGASTATERMRIDRAGNFELGDPSNSNESQLATGRYLQLIDTTDGPQLSLRGQSPKLFFDCTSGGIGEIYLDGSQLRFLSGTPGTAGTERMRLDDDGQLLIGASSQIDTNAASRIQVTHTGGAKLILARNDSSVTDGNNLGSIRFKGNDGGTYQVAAEIKCDADAGHANDDKPGRLVFLTTADGSATQTERMRIASHGNIFIGRTSDSNNAGHSLFQDGFARHCRDGNTVMAINRNTDDGNLIIFQRGGAQKGTISVSGNTVTYGAFCGSHWGRLGDSSKPEILPGTILETINQAVEWKVIEFTVDGEQKRQAYNGSEENGASVTVEYEGVSYTGIVADEEPDSEDLNKHVCVKVSDTSASKAVFGVFLGWDDQEDLEGNDGVIGSWNDMNIAAIGNYFIRIKSGQSLEIGDLIESDGTGCGVVQSDDIIRSKTVGKVTSTTPQQTYADGSFLVTCVLYSG